MRNEGDTIGIQYEAQRVQHEAIRTKEEAERMKTEVIQFKHEATRFKNEAMRSRNEERRTSHEEHRETSFRRNPSGSRSGKDGGLSVISRIDTLEDQGEGSRGQHQGQHQHQHQHHIHHLHQQHHLQDGQLQQHTHEGHEMRRGSGRGGYGRGGRGGRGRGGGGGVKVEQHDHDSDFNHRLDVESQSSSTRPSQTSQAGKLFDPRKDDPVRFASLRTKYGMYPLPSTLTSLSLSNASAGASSNSDIRSLTSHDQSTNASSEGKERRRRRGPSSRTTNESGDGKRDSVRENGHNTNSYVIELKRCYREVALLEAKLQDQHRLANERQRRDQAESSSSSHLISSRHLANRLGYTATGELDHQYWYELTAKHRQLAETHAAFMEAALRPGLPASLHSLPQNYNIPTRLWQTAFHSLLERLRYNLPSISTSALESAPASETASFRHLQSEVLDILVEFIYYAYSFYSNLLESETFRSFRSSWIENLGDLARYRMAVAKLMAKEEASGRQRDKDANKEDLGKSESLASGKGQEERHGPSKERGSIGSGALQDWDLEEKEVWRSTAKDWYAKGLAEMPGIGRLHHHLGILSRDDDLRALHHFCKSLTSSHPYLKARESILPHFERDLQKRRILPGATLVDLFVYLHGILFSKVQLDDFEEIFIRFKEKLQAAVEASADSGAKTEERVSQSAWMMMATINIASLLQYSTDGQEQTSVQKTVIATPESMDGQNTKAIRMEEDDHADAAEEDEGDGSKVAAATSDTLSLPPSLSIPPPSQPEEKPITLQYSARLTFAILSTLTFAIEKDKQRPMMAVNPYITMLLTFVSLECRQPMLLDVMEPHIPWDLLLRLAEAVPSSLERINPQKDIAMRIRGDGGPLAEDWCLRGMAWVGRRTYERGFWKTTRGAGRSSMPIFESEVEVLHRFANISSLAGESLSGGSGGEEDTEGEEAGVSTSADCATITTLRWKRIVYTLTVLIKTVPGLDYQAETGKLILTSPLLERIQGWKAEEESELQQKLRLERLNIKSKEEVVSQVESINDGEDDDDNDSDEDAMDDSDTVRDLKKRRRLLRQQIRESKVTLTGRSRTSTQDVVSQQQQQQQGQQQIQQQGQQQGHAQEKRPFKKLPFLAGYTVLVLDTNVMLTPISVLEQLVESQKWCTVIPLVTVTELEGLTKRPGVIGQRAQKAIDYLAANLKSKTNYLKVQTSRGNYLSDLRFRTEDIDFSSLPNNRGMEEGDDENHKMARSIDEVIVYCLEWQVKNFTDRSAVFCKNREDMIKTQSQVTKETYKAVLITLDVNLRLKARFRGFTALGPKTLIDVLAPA